MSVSTLAGTTWVINSNPRTNTLWSHCGTYNINYHFGGISYGNTVATATTFVVSGMGPPEDPSPILFSLQGACSAIDGEDNISPADYVSTMETAYDSTGGYIGVDGDGVYHGTDLYYYDDSGNAPWDGWTLSSRTIEIIDGAAVTNANLIAWLEANAEQQIPDIDYLTTTSELTSVANAIRAKGGTSASLVYPAGFVTAIQNIPTGTTPTYDTTTANPEDVASGKTFYKATSTSAVSKQTGYVTDCRTNGYTASAADISLYNNNVEVDLTDGGSSLYGIIANTAKIPYNVAAYKIGLIDTPVDTTSSKIVAGNTILGVSGTGGGTHTVTIKSSGNSSFCYISYNNTSYYTVGNTFTVPHGATITCYVSNMSKEVKVNGQPVASDTYTYTVNSDVTALLKYSAADTSRIWLATNGYVYSQNKTVVSNGTVTADTGYDALGTVTVNIPVYDGSVV